MKKHNVDILVYDSNTTQRSTASQDMVKVITLTGDIRPYRNSPLYSVMGHQKVKEFIDGAEEWAVPDVMQIVYTAFKKMYQESEGETIVLHDIYADLIQKTDYDHSYNQFINDLSKAIQALVLEKVEENTEEGNENSLEFFRTLLSTIEHETE